MTYAVDGAVATITMSTPSLGLAAKQMLLAAVTEAAGDDGVRAVVLTGTGRVFTAGQDLREHADALREAGPDAFGTIAAHYNPLITALATMAKPVLAAINGTCAGAGLGLALACDLRIAAQGARFATAFTGIGLTPDSGLSASLARAVGTARASELIILSTPFTAEDALSWGCRPAGARGRTGRHRPGGGLRAGGRADPGLCGGQAGHQAGVGRSLARRAGRGGPGPGRAGRDR